MKLPQHFLYSINYVNTRRAWNYLCKEKVSRAKSTPERANFADY